MAKKLRFTINDGIEKYLNLITFTLQAYILLVNGHDDFEKHFGMKKWRMHYKYHYYRSYTYSMNILSRQYLLSYITL